MSRSKSTTTWDDATDVPRAGMPNSIALEKQRKRWRRGFFIVPILISAMVAYVVTTGSAQDETTAQQMQASTPGRAAAQQAVVDWLAQSPSPLPGATVLSWDGARDMSVEADPAAGQAALGYSLELHSMTLVIAATGEMFNAGVQVAVSDLLGVQVLSAPSFTPKAPDAASSDWPTVQQWPTLTTVTVPESVKEAVTAWGKAYTSADPKVLRLSVGDPNPEHGYMPLLGVSGFAAQATTGGAAGVVTDGKTPAQIVVRVKLSLEWTGVEYGQSKAAPVTELDLLVDRADTAAPVVVAWGAPGDGADLVPYANAVLGRDLAHLTTSTPAPAATDEPAATATATATEIPAPAAGEGE